MGKKKIYFRADAGANIGYGHFIRTLALADMLKDDFECMFFTQSPTEYQRQELEKVCDFVALPSDESKFELFLTYLEGDEIVVLDNYFFTTEYQREIKAKGCKLVCIDDIHDKHYVADVVINHMITDRSLFSVEPNTMMCLGLNWVLLRRSFLSQIKRDIISSTYKNIVICFGGSDYFNLTQKYIDFVVQDPNVSKIVAIVGDGYKFEKRSSSKVEYKSKLTAEEIKSLFCSFDLAILSASTVCIEAIACKIPVAVGWYVENQMEIYGFLKDGGGVYPLGNLVETTSFEPSSIPLLSTPYIDTNSISSHYISVMKLIDIKDSIQTDRFQFVNYTLLSEDQHRTIWSERNSDDIRIFMDNPERFSFDNHLNFVKSLRTGSDRIYWGVFEGDDFVASVNIDVINQNDVEVGIFLSTQFLDRRYGSLIMSNTEKILKSVNFKCVHSRVRLNNERSLAFFKKNGFSVIEQDRVHYRLTKNINE